MNRFFSIVFILFFVSLAALSQTEPITYKTELNISYREATSSDLYMSERCKLDVYVPEGVKGFVTVVWFHGGGLTGGEKSIPERLKNQGIAIVAANYRLSPKVKCEASIDDAAAVVAWVFKNIGRYGGDPEKIVVSGHSAGGYLSAMVAFDKHYLSAYGVDANAIQKVVPFSGQMITHFEIRKERGIASTQPVIDQFAPLFHVRPDAPPLYLITGGRDIEMLGRYEENAYMWRMMGLAGHKHTSLYELDGFDHGGMAIPAFDLLLKIIKH